MKENYRRLAVLMRWFPDAFYTITIRPGGIDLQGKFHPKTVQKARLNRFGNAEFTDSGFAELIRGNITITLTN